MMLSELMPDAQLSQDVRFTGLADNSREVTQGDVFLACPGHVSDGRRFAGDAVSRGAVAVISEKPAPAGLAVPVVEVENLNQSLGQIAARYHRYPSRQMKVMAVTGTNGKTSFTHFLASALNKLGIKCGVIGTIASSHTTPPALHLQARLRELLDLGYQALAIEASSHGLDQGRLNGTEVDVAVLTNLTHDHLDYHGSLADYEAAKARLFNFPALSASVINLDDDFGRRLNDRLPNVVTYSAAKDSAADVRALDASWQESGLKARLAIRGIECNLDLPIYGDFNLQNLLAVAATLLALKETEGSLGQNGLVQKGLVQNGLDQNGLVQKGLEKVASAMQAIKPVAGRMDRLTLPASMPPVFIDYAHTPDALRKCLQAVKQHFPTRPITLVFGCGGDRDKAKRPVMGQIAAEFAERLIITSDNPRHEDPQQIINEILRGVMEQMEQGRSPEQLPPNLPKPPSPSGASGAGGVRGEREQREARGEREASEQREADADRVMAEPDRERAIIRALEVSGADDLVLIAGKGHETYQVVADERHHFSDHDVVLRQAAQMSRADWQSEGSKASHKRAAHEGYSVIVGLAETGLSYARHLASQGVQQVKIMDDNPAPQRQAAANAIFPDASITPLDAEALKGANAIYLSPGVPLNHPALQAARQAGLPICGDVGLLGRLARAPVIAVTGTNGKSTVARLIHDIFSHQQAGVRLGGNIGTPCLDLLDDEASLYVLEVSSFQMELADDLAPEVAMVLNLAPDHLDRYATVQDYYQAKCAIYDHCRKAVVNRALLPAAGNEAALSGAALSGAALSAEKEAALSAEKEAALSAGGRAALSGAALSAGGRAVLSQIKAVAEAGQLVSIGFDKPDSSASDFFKADASLGLDGDTIMLGNQPLLTAEEIPLKGRHNLLNIQAALGAGLLMGQDLPLMLEAVRNFKGLPHRGELVAQSSGVSFINDSKATNPSATLASVKGFAHYNAYYNENANTNDNENENESDKSKGKHVRLLLGGEDKGLSFADVASELGGLVCKAYIYGASRAAIALALESQVQAEQYANLEAAVAAAAAEARPGDLVLLAPGCASFDEFDNFAARGDAFCDQVGRDQVGRGQVGGVV